MLQVPANFYYKKMNIKFPHSISFSAIEKLYTEHYLLVKCQYQVERDNLRQNPR